MKKQILFSLIFLLFFIASKASHYMGGQITYRWVSGNNYIVKLTIYRDCAGIPLSTTTGITISSGTNSLNVSLPRVSSRDVTLLCSNQTSLCNGSGGAFGVEEHIYEDVISFPQISGVYTISFSGCCRNGAITTLTSPSSQQLFLSATLDPNLTIKNTSADLLNIPIANFAPNQLATLSPSGFDADGDVLKYSLVSAKDLSETDPVNYAVGFSATNPLTSSTPITINPNNGIISFTPSVSNQVAIIAIKVEEYRGGVKIGEITRDIQVRVFNINNNYPSITPVNTNVVAVGQTYCTNIVATDANNDSIDLSLVGLVPNSSFALTTDGVGNAAGNFCFTPTAADAGRTFTFTVNAVDNHCPVVLASSMTFNVVVPLSGCKMVTNIAASNVSSCVSNNGTASIAVPANNNPYSFYWTGPNGFTATSQTITNLATGSYCVTVVDGNGCVINKCIDVLSDSSSIEINAVNTKKVCKDNIGGTVVITAFGGVAPYQYSLNSGALQSNNTFTALIVGTYAIQVVDALGCSSVSTVTVSPFVATTATQTLTSCSGKLDYNGNTYNSSTIVKDTLKNVDGCDSLYRTTNILISKIKTAFVFNTINACGSAAFEGLTYTNSTVLKDTIRTVNGCDSIIKQTNINITPLNIVKRDTVMLNGCGQVTYNNVIYSSNTVVVDTTLLKDSCKANIRVAIITANAGLNLTLSNTSSICATPQILSVDGVDVNKISRIDWYRDGVFVETSLRNFNFTDGKTVAGISGVSGSATTHLNDPHGVFVVGNDMYISDFMNHRILRWAIGATNGTVVAGGNGLGNAANKLAYPSNVFVKPNGDVYITDYGADRIQLWTSGATTGTTVVSGLSSPRGMFVRANGDIIVANSRANEIRNGANIMYLNVGNNIANICEDAAGNMYVADQGNNRILKYAPNATSPTIAASLSLSGIGLNAPWGVFVDNANQLYVTENGSHNLLRFPANSNATTLPNFSIGTGVAGTANNQFIIPNGVFVDGRGRIFVADGFNHRIQMFDSTIKTTHTTYVSGKFTAVITDANGCVTYLGAIDVHIPPVVKNDTTFITTPACSYEYKGKRFLSNTIFIEDTLRTSFGCDSVINYVKIDLAGRNDTRDTIRLNSCGSLYHNNVMYNSSTVLRDTTSITDTCTMHIVVTEITINQLIRDTVRLSGCGSVTYNGRAYTNSIVIRDTISAIGNCITNLKVIEITVAPSPTPTITFLNSVCSNPRIIGVVPTIPYSLITWKNGSTVVASGANQNNLSVVNTGGYSVQIQYQNGCSATAFIGVSVMPQPSIVYIDSSNCGAFIFNGILITKDTIILKDTLRNSSGCITQIRYNRFKVNPAFIVPNLSVINPCKPTLTLSNVEKNATIRWYKDGVAVVNPPIYKQQGVTVFGNGAVGAGAISLADATGMVIDKHDNLFLADDRNNRILKYSLVSNTLLATITGINRPLGIFVDDNDTLYSYNKPTQVVRFNSNYTSTTLVANIYNNPSYGIAKDQFNNLYANAWFDHYVNQYKPNNNAGANFMSGVFEPFALYAKGISLHIVDHYYNRVYTKNILTGSSSYFTTAAAAPSGCYVDDYQNMYIVTQVDGAVRFKQKNSNTQYLMVGNNGIGNAANQLNAPYGIAFDSKKNMYISDDYNHRVQRFDFVANYDTALSVTTNGVYTVRIENEYGCGVTLGPIAVSLPIATKDTTTIIACGTKVTYFGKTYTTNTYINLDTVKSVAGCDSIIHIGYLQLTPNLTPSLSILVRGSDRICKGSNFSVKAFPVNGGTNPQYQWTVNGVPVAGATGVYFISNSLNNGDTIRCILTSNYPCVTSNDIVSNYVIARIATPTFKQVNISGCNSVTVNNIVYQNSTTVLDTVRNNIGCDSIVTTTNITINKVNAETVTNNIVGCNSVVYKGVTYINSITLKDTLRTTNGCDSLYRINNIVVIKIVAVTNIINVSGCGSVTYKERKYTTSVVLNDTIKSILGCDSVYNITNITINSLVTPTIVITPSQNPVCNATNIIYSSTITNGGSNPQYQWYKNGILIPGATSATYSNAGLPDSTTVYTCTLTSNAPCAEPKTVVSNSVRLTFGGAAVASISIVANQTTICSSAIVTFTATAINGGNNPQYQWKKNGVNIIGANAATYSAANIVNNDVFTCALVSNSLCVNNINAISNNIAIIVNANSTTYQYNNTSTVNPTIIAPNSMLINTSAPISTTLLGGVWSAGFGSVQNGMVSFTGINPGSNYVYYTIFNQDTKCTLVVNKNILVVHPAGEITGNKTICNINGITTLTSIAGYSGTWTSSNPSVANVTGSSSNGGIRTAVITGLSAGTAVITYNMQTYAGYIFPVSTTITVAPVIVAPIIGNSIACVGATTQLTNATPNGVWSSIAGRATVSATGLVTGTSVGVAEIRYTVNNTTTNCSGYAAKTMVVNPMPGIPTIGYAPVNVNPQAGAGGGSNFCRYRTFDVRGTPLGGVWSSSNTSAMTISSLGTINTVGLGATIITYTITLNGCSNSRSIPTNVVACANKGTKDAQTMTDNVQIVVYPNPAKTFFNVKINKPINGATIVVTNVYGKQVYQSTINNRLITVDCSKYAKGIYFISVIENENKITKKLIVD